MADDEGPQTPAPPPAPVTPPPAPEPLPTRPDPRLTEIVEKGE